MAYTSPVLPFELLLQVASFIQTRVDLLALASTCHALYNTFVPHWLDFIDIACPIPFTPLWAHLSERPTLCRRIQTLKITDSMTLEEIRDPSLQSSFREFLTASPSSTDQSPQLLYNVLLNLKNLSCFRGFFKSSSVTSVIRVADCLKQSGCTLEELELCMMTSFDEGRVKRARFSCFNLNLSFLSKLSITIGDYDHEEAVGLIRILADIPNLKQLKLCPPNRDDCINALLLDLFTKCRWPKLRDISLRQIYLPNVVMEAYSSALRTFLSRHTGLETFYFDNRLLPGCFRKSTAEFEISQLKAIHFIFPTPNTATSCQVGNVLPIHISRNLVHLSLLGVSNAHLGIQANGLHSLRSCSLPRIVSKSQFAWIAEFVEAAPNLEKCAVSINSSFCITEIAKVVQILSSLKKLTHLINILANVDLLQTTMENENERRIIDYLAQMPSLTFLNTIVPHKGSQFIRLSWSCGLSKLPQANASDAKLGTKLSPSPFTYETISGSSLVSHMLEYNKWGKFF